MMRNRLEDGFSLVEVMVAMVISGTALVGAMGAVHLSARSLQEGMLAQRALEQAQARVEAKRSVRWASLLEDDLDHDGAPDVWMTDDGQGSDVTAGDGVYTGVSGRDGIGLVWTVEADHPGPLSAAGSVAIVAVASFRGSRGMREVRVGTVRANPVFVGAR